MNSLSDKISTAKALLGTQVRFHHDPTPRLVTKVTPDGMLEVEGFVGQFAASLFETVEFCASCGHSYAQHTKGPVKADYCRHCPCTGFRESKS